MEKKGKGLISKIKRDLGVFLSSEEGKILEKNVIETAAILGIMGAGVMIAEAQVAPTHTNYLHNQGATGQLRGRHVSHSSSPAHSEKPPEPQCTHINCYCDKDNVKRCPVTKVDPPCEDFDNTDKVKCEVECLGTHDNWVCNVKKGKANHISNDCTQELGHVNNIKDLAWHKQSYCEGEVKKWKEYCIGDDGEPDQTTGPAHCSADTCIGRYDQWYCEGDVKKHDSGCMDVPGHLSGLSDIDCSLKECDPTGWLDIEWTCKPGQHSSHCLIIPGHHDYLVNCSI